MDDLSPEDAARAKEMAAIAARAEARAEARAAARAAAKAGAPAAAAPGAAASAASNAAESPLSFEEQLQRRKAEKRAAAAAQGGSGVVFRGSAQRARASDRGASNKVAKRARPSEPQARAPPPQRQPQQQQRGGRSDSQRWSRGRDQRHTAVARAPRRSAAEVAEAAQLQAIKDGYLGTNRPVKKSRKKKTGSKFKQVFHFDWDASEDTSQDLNPLYQRRQQPQIAYGRGYQAGIDMREQRKKNKYMEDVLRMRKSALAAEERSASGGGGRGTGRGSSASTASSSRGGSTSSASTALDTAIAAAKQKRIDEVEALSKSSIGAVTVHWSEKSLEEMAPRDWRILREDYDIRVKGGRASLPLRKWGECKIDPRIQMAIDDMGFKEPSPIQRQALPIGLLGRDIIGIAETGSGKTAAFIIPMLQYVLRASAEVRARTPTDGPLGLVMAPTRELAQQIHKEGEKLAAHVDVRMATIVGGKSIEEQGFKVREGVDIIVATPGRMLDCLERRYVVLNQCVASRAARAPPRVATRTLASKHSECHAHPPPLSLFRRLLPPTSSPRRCVYLILDEADRMIDMGFETTVIKILDSMGTLLKAEDAAAAAEQESLVAEADGTETSSLYRITSLFSATMPPSVERIAQTYLRCPATIRIGDVQSMKNARIEQRVIWTSEGAKRKKLKEILATSAKPCIVFVNIKNQCDVVSRDIGKWGHRVVTLHGGKAQDQREAALLDFRQGKYDVLCATDVAARGIDVADVQHVINYDMAFDIDRYLHRIGRTGRAGKSGKATTLLIEEDNDKFWDLKQYLTATNQPIPSELARHPMANVKPGSALQGKDAKKYGERAGGR